MEDEVVKELEVFFNPSIDPQTKLYAFEYPLGMPYDLDQRCQGVRLKLGSHEVEVDLTVQDAEHMMEKETLATQGEAPYISGYAVGVQAENELYLMPIHKVVQLQLRPLMNHPEPIVENDVNPENEEIKEEEKRNVGWVTWVPLNYHMAESVLATTHLGEMAKKEGYELQIDFLMSLSDYVNALLQDAPARPIIPPEHKWALLGAIEEIFRAVKICRMDQIIQLLMDATATRADGHLIAESLDAYIDGVKQMVDTRAINIGGICYPKSSPDYNNKKYDKFREVVLREFDGVGLDYKIKRKAFELGAMRMLKRKPNQKEYNTVLHELCDYDLNAWALKKPDHDERNKERILEVLRTIRDIPDGES